MKHSAQLLAAAIALALNHTAIAEDDPSSAPQSIQAKIDALQKQLDELKAEQQKNMKNHALRYLLAPLTIAIASTLDRDENSITLTL
jgi:adenine-specific DNA methylase